MFHLLLHPSWLVPELWYLSSSKTTVSWLKQAAQAVAISGQMQVTQKWSFTLRWIVRVFPALNGLSLCWVCFLTVFSFIVCSNSAKPLMFWQRVELPASKLRASILCTVCQKANDCLKTSKVMQMLIQLCDSFVEKGGLLWVLIFSSSNSALLPWVETKMCTPLIRMPD